MFKIEINKILDTLKEVTLFNGIDENDIKSLIPCLNYRIKTFDKGSNIILPDEVVENIGIVIEGIAEITKEDIEGNKTIVSILTKGNMFAESIVCRKNKKSPVCVTSIEECKVLFISYDKVIRSCTNRCEFHVNLINNLLITIAEKNFILNNKIDILLLKGLRERIAKFLIRKYKESGQTSFNINLNRNRLAEYLNVSRSALSRELSRMKDENIIDYYQNSFKILNIKSLTKVKQKSKNDQGS